MVPAGRIASAFFLPISARGRGRDGAVAATGQHDVGTARRGLVDGALDSSSRTRSMSMDGRPSRASRASCCAKASRSVVRKVPPSRFSTATNRMSVLFDRVEREGKTSEIERKASKVPPAKFRVCQSMQARKQAGTTSRSRRCETVSRARLRCDSQPGRGQIQRISAQGEGIMIRNLLATTALATLVATGRLRPAGPGDAAPAPRLPRPRSRQRRGAGDQGRRLSRHQHHRRDRLQRHRRRRPEHRRRERHRHWPRTARSQSVVVGVGGFLGIGEKNVAVEFAKLDWAEKNGDRWLVAPTTKEQLRGAAGFRPQALMIRLRAGGRERPGRARDARGACTDRLRRRRHRLRPIRPRRATETSRGCRRPSRCLTRTGCDRHDHDGGDRQVDADRNAGRRDSGRRSDRHDRLWRQ